MGCKKVEPQPDICMGKLLNGQVNVSGTDIDLHNTLYKYPQIPENILVDLLPPDLYSLILTQKFLRSISVKDT